MTPLSRDQVVGDVIREQIGADGLALVRVSLAGVMGAEVVDDLLLLTVGGRVEFAEIGLRLLEGQSVSLLGADGVTALPAVPAGAPGAAELRAQMAVAIDQLREVLA